MEKIWKANWIIDEQFYGLTPINIFCKESEVETTHKHREDLKNHHMLFRKGFTVSKDISNAYIDITADDYYKLYINGQFVGQGPAPSYYFHYNYNRLDISRFLKKGENIIAVHVYYQGLVNRVWNSGDYRQGLLAEVFIDDELTIYTDSSWKYITSKEYTGTDIIGYKTQYIENIDMRLVEHGWKDIGFDDKHWSNAFINICDDHKTILQISEPLQVYEKKPCRIDKICEGHYIVDFGHEITGQFKIEAKGTKGQIVEIRCGEELNEENEQSVRFDMRCNCTYKELWTLSGRYDVLEHFDYKAFRYVEVLAPEGVILTHSFSALVRHYPFDDDRCKFHTSNKKLNDIWSLCKNGVKYGTQEVYVDCPSREKGQYLGDFTVTGHSHIYLSGDYRLYKKALLDFALSSYICPGLMAVAPGSYMQEIADFSLQWPQNLLLYYKHSGDIEFLKEMYPIAERCVKYFDNYRREDGLLENVTGKWNMVDWPENLRDNYDFVLTRPVKKGCHNVINAFYIGALKTLYEIKNILNISACYEEIKALEKAFLKVFYDYDKKLFVDAEKSSHCALHSNVIPLYYGIAPQSAVESIVNLIKERRFSCGVYVSYFILKGLASIEEYDLIYDLIINEDDKSWNNMLREGGTTCFEAWGKEQKWNTSLCHPWASSPISVLIEDVVGLKPSKPGWEEIEFNPQIPNGISSLSLELKVKSGLIVVNYQNGSYHIKAPNRINVKTNRVINNS